MEKARFSYTKEDGTKTERTILKPSFLKEATNSLKHLDNENVNYIQGFEVEKEGLTEDQIKEYEEAIGDYFEMANKTLTEWVSDLGLDAKKVKQKVFKKKGVEKFEIIS